MDFYKEIKAVEECKRQSRAREKNLKREKVLITLRKFSDYFIFHKSLNSYNNIVVENFYCNEVFSVKC